MTSSNRQANEIASRNPLAIPCPPKGGKLCAASPATIVLPTTHLFATCALNLQLHLHQTIGDILERSGSENGDTILRKHDIFRKTIFPSPVSNIRINDLFHYFRFCHLPRIFPFVDDILESPQTSFRDSETTANTRSVYITYESKIEGKE